MKLIILTILAFMLVGCGSDSRHNKFIKWIDLCENHGGIVMRKYSTHSLVCVNPEGIIEIEEKE